MSLITKYGSFWGFLPLTHGRYFWVAPAASYTVEGNTYEASDNNDGLSPERALRTIAYAVSLTTANVGDVIVLLPGLHTSAAVVTVNKAGITITGIPGGRPHANLRMPASGKRQKSRVTNTGTAGIIFNVTATDVEIAHLHLAPTAAGGRGISLDPTVQATGGAHRAYIHDVMVAMVGTASVTTYGITVPAVVTADVLEDVLISHCYFQSGLDTSSGANGSAVNALGTVHGMTIENSTFELKGTAAWATAILASNAGSLGIVVRECDAINPTSSTTVITTFLNTTGQTIDGSAQMHRCYIPAGTDGVTSTAGADCVLAENYLASGAGGALIANT